MLVGLASALVTMKMFMCELVILLTKNQSPEKHTFFCFYNNYFLYSRCISLCYPQIGCGYLYWL